MGRLDTLPADQRAVVGLLARQGKSYDELSGLLNLDAATVRERAHAALAALGAGSADDLDPDRRDELADFLLGQGTEVEREAARVFLAGSADGRRWARAVATELAPIAGDRLPEIPDEPAGEAQAESAAPAQAEPAAAAPAAAAPTEPPVSRKGGVIVLAIFGVLIAIVAAGAIAFGAFSGGDEGGPGGRVSRTMTTGDTTTGATSSNPTTKIRAQANVTAPPGASAPKALGVIQVVEVKGQRQLIAIVQGLPTPGRGQGYGIWLTAPDGRRTWLGFFQSADKQGRLVAQGALRRPIAGYDQMLVTRETGSAPKRPGRIYLQGRIQRPKDSGG